MTSIEEIAGTLILDHDNGWGTGFYRPDLFLNACVLGYASMNLSSALVCGRSSHQYYTSKSNMTLPFENSYLALSIVCLIFLYGVVIPNLELS